FPGALPWIGVLAIPFVLWSKNVKSSDKKFITFLFTGFLLSLLFCLNMSGFTLYRAIYELPGFASMRSLNRLMNSEIIYFVLLFVFVFNMLRETNKTLSRIILVFP